MDRAHGESLRRRTFEVLFLAGALLFGSLASPVLAQDRDTVELQFGGGYVWGGGNENPGPSLATYNLGVAVWVSDHWGVAARHVVGPGTDLWGPPVDESRDRTYIGQGNLRYTTVTARRRWFMTGSTQLDVGFGLMLDGSYEGMGFLKRPGRAPLYLGTDIIFGGWSFEMFAGRKLSRYFGVKGGFTEDFNFETANTQLVGLAVVGF